MTSQTITPRPHVDDEFVRALADRAADAERARRLSDDTVRDAADRGLFDLLVPRRYGGVEATMPEIMEPVRRMAHGCTSSAWTLGFYVLHNWMTALFDERAQQEAFADRPFLAPAPLAPTGRATLDGDHYVVSGRWSWATGVPHGNWIMVGTMTERDGRPTPLLALLPIGDVEVVDTWHTDGMRATGSHDVVVDGARVPAYRTITVADMYSGKGPGAALHEGSAYRWPMVPALALLAAMPALGTAERITDLYAARLAERVLAYQGTKQKDKPAAQIRLTDARIRLRALDTLVTDTTRRIEDIVAAGGTVSLLDRAHARLAAAHVVHESRAVIADVFEAAGASVHFLDNPMQRGKRDVDVLAGHVIFDYDVSRELAGALEAGLAIPPGSMI